jgi:carbamate kinase
VAIGGNSLIREGQRGTIPEQVDNARLVARRIGLLVAKGWRIVVTHGNRPQVGFIPLRAELAEQSAPVPRLSLDMYVADSQGGGLGYIVGNALPVGAGGARVARLRRVSPHPDRGRCQRPRLRPKKPIGPFFSAADAEAHRRRGRLDDGGGGRPGLWPRRAFAAAAPDRGRGRDPGSALDAGLVVIAAGGGGIPVVETAPGVYRGVEAVVDKDLASSLRAAGLGLPVLVLSTGVPKVAVWFRRPDQRDLDRVTVSEARRLGRLRVRGTGWARGDRDVPRSPGRRRGRSLRPARRARLSAGGDL